MTKCSTCGGFYNSSCGHWPACSPTDDPPDELATARAEIAALRAQVAAVEKERNALFDECHVRRQYAEELEAQVERLTTVTEEDVERVAKAICRASVSEVYATASARNNAVNKAWPQFMPEAHAALMAHTARGE